MKPFPLAFIAALLLAFGALAAACGDGGEELTLEEYFQRVDAQHEERDRRLDALEEPSTPDFTSGKTEEEIVNGTRDLFEGAGQINEDALDDFNSIDPPAEADEAHREFSAALAAANSFNEDLVDRLQDVRSTAELNEALDQLAEAEFMSDERFGAACFALQAVADDKNVAVDLNC